MKIKPFLLYLIALSLVSSSYAASVRAEDNEDEQEIAQEQSPADNAPVISTNVTGSYLAGQFARNNGHMEVAIRSLQRVHREEPENKTIAVQLQGMLLMQGHIGEAMELAAEIRKSGKADALSTLLLTLHEVKKGDDETAVAILEDAASKGSVQLWLPLARGWLNISSNGLDKPLTIEDVGLDVGRAAPLVNYHLALINSQAGFKDEAAKNFKSAIEDPKDPPSRIMSQLLRFYDQDDAPEILVPLVQAYRESHPDVESNGNIPAVTTARDGVAEILYTMGSIMFGAGVAGDAAIYLQLTVYLKPELSEAVVALGDAYGALRQYDRANETYAKITPKSYLYTKAQLHIAVNNERMGKLKEAVALLDKMAKQSPHEAEALITKGDLLRIHAHYREAVEAYTLALKRIPEMKSMFWPIFFARGTCYERQGKWPEAEKDMIQALALKPEQPDVMNYLGFSWLERGMHVEEARDMIAKAVTARPDDAQIVDSMGWVLYMEGDYQKSMSYLEKAVELLPGDPTVNDHLGDVYWRLGRKNEARFQWERALSFSPEAKLEGSLHKKLKEGLPPTHLATTQSPTIEQPDPGVTQ